MNKRSCFSWCHEEDSSKTLDKQWDFTDKDPKIKTANEMIELLRYNPSPDRKLTIEDQKYYSDKFKDLNMRINLFRRKRETLGTILSRYDNEEIFPVITEAGDVKVQKKAFIK